MIGGWQGKFSEVENVVKAATEEKQQAVQELQSVQKQRQREADNASRQTKIALNTLRREKDTLAEQVRTKNEKKVTAKRVTTSEKRCE